MVADVIEMTKRPCTTEKTGSMNDLLLDAIDETLQHIFKEEGAKAIYTFLENNNHLRRQEIAEKPEIFSAGLEKLMVSAAQVIERMILERLYSKLGLKFREREGYEFSDYVRELREACGG